MRWCKMNKVLRDTPLMELTLRRYERPDNFKDRELVKKFCLSIGILQPGDSRDIIVDVLFVLLKAKKDRYEISSEKIRERVIELRKHQGLSQVGVASSNIRRQIKRLRDLFLVEKVKNSYRISEFSNLSDTYEDKIKQFLLPPILKRVKDYFDEIDKSFE